LQALVYGPVVLVGPMGAGELNKDMTTGHYGLRVKPDRSQIPVLTGDCQNLDSWVKPASGQPLNFHALGQSEKVTLSPLYKLFDQRYTVYWKVSPRA